MKAISSVLAAVDFSADSRRAALRAAFIAAEQKARLELLHVMSESSLDALRRILGASKRTPAALRDVAQSALSDLAAELNARSGVGAALQVKVGDVLEAILAASRRVDMLAIGAKGMNPLHDMILGTTAAHLLGKCRVPVLVVRRAPRGPYKRVLVPVDFSQDSAFALRLAGLVAPAAETTVLHAFTIPFEGKLRYAGVSDDHLRKLRAHARAEAMQGLVGLIGSAGAGGPRLRPAVVSGSAGRAILAKERTLDADLVVIGKHGRSRIEQLLLGSVARHVLANSTCDVLVVHGPPAAG